MTIVKSTIAAAVLGLFVAINAHPAQAAKNEVNRWVHNKTDHCVWFTIDQHATMARAWWNVEYRFIPAGESYLFKPVNSEYVKVRAEPRATKACSGGKVADLDVTTGTDMTVVPPSDTTLRGGSGQPFHLSWGK